MQSRVQLFINGPSSGTTLGEIELYPDEPISITYENSDITDITTNKSSGSQNFMVPANRDTNRIFNHIFNIGSDASFNPTIQTPAWLEVDSIMVIQGNLQLVSIKTKNKNVLSYEVVLFGEVADLSKSLGDSLITDLDFSELDHYYTSDAIEDSWTANTKNHGFYYPLIDLGFDLDLAELNSGVLSIVLDGGAVTSATNTTLTNSASLWATNAFAGKTVNIIDGAGVGQSKTILSNTLTTLTISASTFNPPLDTSSRYNITQLDYTNPYGSTGDGMSPLLFRPALSNTYLIKKIFQNAGFTAVSDLLEDERIGETITPFNGNTDSVLTQEYMDEYAFRTALGSNMVLNQNQASIIQFSDVTTPPNFDNGGLFNTATKRYTADRVSCMSFVVNLRVEFTGSSINPNKIVAVDFYRQGPGPGPAVSFSTKFFPIANPTLGIEYNFTAECDPMDNPTSQIRLQPLSVGEEVFAVVSFNGGGTHQCIVKKTDTYMYNIPKPKLVPGVKILYNKFLLQNTKQIDYLKSVLSMFNLLVIPDKNNNKKLSLIPRSEYNANGEVKDWTLKLDNTKPIEDKLVSEQQKKTILFTYKLDTDYLNNDFYTKTNTVFGQERITIDNEWIDGEKKIELIFASTPTEKIAGTTDIYAPKIAKRDLKTGQYGRTDFAPRFLRKRPVPLDTVNTIQLQGKPPRNSYPYCSHLDHPTESTVDYNFGTVPAVYYELDYITRNNLINVYWKEYLDDLNDKNSRIISCYIYLKPADIAQFNYNDSIYIEGITDDGGCYYLVNKLEYVPTNNQSSYVELIKINRAPTQAVSKTRAGRFAFDSILNKVELGDAKSLSTNTIVAGNGNYIGSNSEYSLLMGLNNSISNNVQNAVSFGNNNVIGDNASNTFIIGNNVQVGNTLVSSTGTSTTVSGVTLLGVYDYTATTSNTVYMPNLQFTSSSSTINGQTINNIISGSSIWSAGTGIESIYLNNNTGNIAAADYAFVTGNNNQILQNSSNPFCSIIGGFGNIISD